MNAINRGIDTIDLVEDRIHAPRYTADDYLKLLLNSIDVGLGCEKQECDRLVVTTDPYGTGDHNEKVYGCGQLIPRRCPRLFEDECEAGRIARELWE